MKQYFYVYLNDDDIVHGDTGPLSSPIESDFAIEVPSLDPSLYGKKYNRKTGKFTALPQAFSYTPPPVSNEQLAHQISELTASLIVSQVITQPINADDWREKYLAGQVSEAALWMLAGAKLLPENAAAAWEKEAAEAVNA